MERNHEISDLSVCPLVQGEEGEASHSVPEPEGVSQITRGKVVAAALVLVGLTIGVASVAQTYSISATGLVGLEETDPAEVQSDCSADGEACLDSKCCVPGGPSGLQCYSKNDNWAACAPSCEPGVHEPEEEGTWDETGTFVKAEWSCKKLGNVSKPGCEAFADKIDDCPEDYCAVKGETCVPKCDTYRDSGACWDSKVCMWQDDSCMDACWSFDAEDSCHPTNKCYWTGEKCQMGWWLFNDHDSCDQSLGYKWNGSCVLDPCSMVGEDCSKTKCCSTERGASGMTCFKKDQFWATCQETCQPQGNWSCEKLGKRANYSAGCAWAGKDCAVDKLCCNRGFVCAVKDADFTGCVLTKKTSTWVAMEVPIPSNWEGTVVGAGRDEFQIPQRGPDDTPIGTTLYCFMAYLPGTYEDELIKLAQTNNASIYGCDKPDLFHTWQSDSAGWDTGESTLRNTDVFVKVWEQVQERGDFENYDWTVKVDPDCVFAPIRLKSHIESWNLADWAAVYVKNNGQDPGLGNNGFLGAIEIFSKKAVNIYHDNAAGCVEALGFDAGEDGFMKGCMDGIGIGYVMDIDIFFPDNGAGACTNEARVAFHPLKDPEKWQRCWDILLGKKQW